MFWNRFWFYGNVLAVGFGLGTMFYLWSFWNVPGVLFNATVAYLLHTQYNANH